MKNLSQLLTLAKQKISAEGYDPDALNIDGVLGGDPNAPTEMGRCHKILFDPSCCICPACHKYLQYEDGVGFTLVIPLDAESIDDISVISSNDTREPVYYKTIKELLDKYLYSDTPDTSFINAFERSYSLCINRLEKENRDSDEFDLLDAHIDTGCYGSEWSPGDVCDGWIFVFRHKTTFVDIAVVVDADTEDVTVAVWRENGVHVHETVQAALDDKLAIPANSHYKTNLMSAIFDYDVYDGSWRNE